MIEREDDSEKYEQENWLAKKMIARFQKKISLLLANLDYNSLHEVGCGEGYSLNFLIRIKEANISASDVSAEALTLAEKKHPQIKFYQASVYKSPFNDNQFDLVVASQVLEHLKNPQKALLEIKRISNNYCLFTVPYEPLWRILNILRGKYLKSLGNPPTHYYHWSKKGIILLVRPYFSKIKIKLLLPWIIILVKK